MVSARLLGALLLSVALAGCDDNDSSSGSGGLTPGAPISSQLCVSTSCGHRIELMPFPSAENLTFTDSGRLFVSGAGGVYEIHQDPAGAYTRSLVSGEGCTGGLGLAVRGDMLYAVCSGMKLFAGQLTDTPMLTEVFTFTGMCIPNGMALGADGNLYVVDEPLQLCVPDPKIVRLNIDPADPMHIVNQETWLQGSPLGLLAFGLDKVLRFPNGLQSNGKRFYGTDGGSIYSVDLQADGSAGPVTPIFFVVTAHDDLGFTGDSIVAADFLRGSIEHISLTGQSLGSTGPGSFSFPSSVRLGRPPMFRPTDLVITETGVLTDNNLPIDYLSVFRKDN